MEKWNSETEKYNYIDYYCDICESYIDSVNKEDDGYIPPSNGESEFSVKIYYAGRPNESKLVKLFNKSCLCKTCREKAINNIFNTIERAALDMGLKKNIIL